MKTNATILYQLLLLLLVASTSNAQTLIDYRHRTIDDELIGLDEGLNDRVINHVSRDKFGFFYVASQSGFQRYDGVKFENIDYSELTRNSINPNNIADLSTVDGHIIIHTSNSERIFYINPGQTVVKSYELPHLGKILCDKGSIFICNKLEKGYAFSKVNINTFAISTLFHTPFIPNDAHKIRENYYLSHNQKLYCYSSKKLVDVIDFEGQLISNSSTLFLISKGVINSWSGEGITFQFLKIPDSLNLVISTHDQADNILLGFGTTPRFIDKLLLIDSINQLSSLDTILYYSDKFKDIYSDNAKHKIMAVGYEGMHVFTFLQDGAYHFLKRPHLTQTFGNIITGIAINQKNEILFLQEASGLHHLPNLQSKPINKFTKYDGGGVGFKRNGKLYYDTLTNTFISYSYNSNNTSVIHQIDLEKNRLISFLVPFKIYDITPFDSIVYVAGFDKDTNRGVLSTFDLRNDKKDMQEIFSYPKRINSVQVRKNGKEFWLSTIEGVIILNQEMQKIQTLDRHQKIPNKILVEDNIRLTVDYGKYVLAGSIGGGCYVINPDDYSINYVLNKSNGLSDNKAIGFIADNNGYCWVATWNGLNVIDSNLQIVRIFHDYDCLPNNELNTKAFSKDQNGNLYFGSINGMVVIDPHIALNWPKSNGIAFSSIIEHNHPYRSTLVDVYSKSSNDSINFTLVFPDYHTHNYKINKNELEYSLDKNLGKLTLYNNSIVLKDLKSGQGNLKISSKYTKSSINTFIKIQKDFSLLLWFLFSLAVVRGLVYMFTLKSKQAELTKIEISSKIANLELTALQSQMNPHFMFNALGAIQYFIQTHDIERADEYLSNFAHLMRMILESSKNRFITIANEIKLLDLYIGLEKVRFDGKFEYRIEMDNNIDSFFRIPPMIAQPYIENAINHGLINLTDRDGILLIKVKYINEDTIEIHIEDNGIGRRNAKLLRKQNHISRGMQIVRERIASFQSAEKFTVVEKIIDLKDENRKATGTKIVLTYKDLEK